MSITPSAAVDTVKKPTMLISNGNTLYVGGTGEGNYTKIQDAIDDANWGDAVFVYNGTYYENVRIWKIINLIGENKYTTIIDGNYSWDSVIKINTEPVKISGFTIQKSQRYGIECYDWSNLIIEGNIIRENDRSGICFDLHEGYCINNTITNNIITNNYEGINIELSIGPYYYFVEFDITVFNNIITNNYFGIIISEAENLIIRDNNISNNGNGINIRDAENNTVIDNNITKNDMGISLGFAEHNTVRENNITNNNEGIILSHSAQNNIRGNNIINNLIGLNSYNSGMNNISKNNFIGNLRNAYFSISWIYILFTFGAPNFWDSNYWDSWNGNGPKLIFGGLSREGLIIAIILDYIFYNLKLDIIFEIIFRFRFEVPPFSFGRKFVKIPLIQLDRNPAKEPYDIEVVI